MRVKNPFVIEAAADGGYRQATFDEILEAVRAALANRVKKGAALTSTKLTRRCNPEQLRLEVQRQMKLAALAPGLPSPRHYVPARDGHWPGFRFAIDPDWNCGWNTATQDT